MSDELAMEMIEKLSEELGEKELKIMALEKALEEEKKEKLEYYDLCQIKEFKIRWYEQLILEEGEGEFSPQEIVENQFYNAKYNGGDFEIMIETILHYFGGNIMTKEEIIEDIYDFGDCDFEEYIEDEQDCVVNLQNGKYWVSAATPTM
tara:strand:- start:1661 stop:2107 length:447 start_codon:yes stop_codon:yes gene_type:complete